MRGAGLAGSGKKFDLTLLGGFDRRAPEGKPIELPTRKCELLLSYLAMPAGRQHSRDKLAGFFWGDRGDEQARGSLRKALSALRAALGPDALSVDRDSVAVRKDALVVDAEELAMLASDSEVGPVWPDSFRYGEFLDIKPSASAEFEDWLSFERARCRNLAQAVLEKLAGRLAAAGMHSEAQSTGQRLLAVDNLREESHRLLMRLYAEAGERSRALAQFQACRDLLKRELGVEPSLETVRLSREISTDAPAAAGADTAIEPQGAPAQATAWPTERRRGLSIAVLPFSGQAADEQDFVANGLSQDIITELSRQKDFLVIAPQSSFVYGAGARTASVAASELDVRYILSGSVRRAGGRLRVTAQLIDAAGDRCVWAERYDRPAEDVFEVQDEVVTRIIATVDAQVRATEREGAARKRPENLDAWELFHRGMWHAYRFTRQDMEAAQGHFRSAIALSPTFSLPHAGLAYVCFASVTWNFATDVATMLGKGIWFAEAAIALDETEPIAHFVLGRLCTYTGDADRATRHLTTAIELSPSFAPAYFGMAEKYFWSGQPADALMNVKQATRLNPKDPLSSMFMTLSSFCHYWLGDFAAAELAARQAMALNARETWSRLGLAVALVELGRRDEARAVIAEARSLNAKLSVASFDAIVGRVPEELRNRVYVRLREAGLA